MNLTISSLTIALMSLILVLLLIVADKLMRKRRSERQLKLVRIKKKER